MMRTSNRQALCTLLLSMTAVASAAGAQAAAGPQVVAIRVGDEGSGPEGQGFTRARGNDCLVLTPKHVTEKMANAAQVVLSSTRRGDATLQKETPIDLVVLTLTSPQQFGCSTWSPDSNLASLLDNATEGTLVSRDFAGGRLLMPVGIRRVDETQIVIEPRKATDAISQGMSGSLLLVGTVPAGMLYEATEERSGIAYRLDYIERLVGPTFASATPATKPIDPRAAMEVLDRARERKDGSQMMQVQALEQLLSLGNTFNGTEFNGVLLAKARLNAGTLTASQFVLADLTAVEAVKADLSGSNFSFATAETARFDSANVSRSWGRLFLAPRSSWRGANLSGSSFWGADLRGADFRGADLRSTAFPFADLRGARFDGADLRGAYLIGAVLDSAVLTGAVFGETDVGGASFRETSLTPLQQRGACRHGDFYGRRAWTMTLTEEMPEGTAGRRFEDLRRIEYAVENFSGRSLRTCTSSDDGAVRFTATFPWEERQTFSSQLLRTAKRRQWVVDRVQAQAAAVLPRLQLANSLRDTARVAAYASDFRRRASAAAVPSRTLGRLNELTLPFLLVRADGWKPDAMVWDTLAYRRWRGEVGDDRNRTGMDSLAQRSAFYLPDVPWEELPSPDRVTLYRDFILRSKSQAPLEFTCQQGGTELQGATGDSVWLSLDFRFCGDFYGGALEAGEAWKAAFGPVLARVGLIPDRLVPLRQNKAGLDWLFLALPGDAQGYAARIPARVVSNNVSITSSLAAERTVVLRAGDGTTLGVIVARLVRSTVDRFPELGTLVLQQLAPGVRRR